MKYLICLTFLILSVFAYSQEKDSDTRYQHIFSQCPASLAGKSGDGDSLSIKELLADPIVRSIKCIGYTITSFEIAVAAEGSTVQMSSNNDHISNAAFDLLKKLKRGDHIIIENVHYKLSDGKAGTMRGMNLIVKN